MNVLDKEKRKKKLVVNGLLMHAADASGLPCAIYKFLRQNLEIEVYTEAAYKLGQMTSLIEFDRHDL